MLTAVAAAAFCIGGLVRLRPAVTHRDKRPLCLALLCFAAGAVFDVDPAYAAFDRVVGVTNLSDLMAHGLGLVGVYFLLRTLDGLTAKSGAEPAPAAKSGGWLLPFLVMALLSSAGLFVMTSMPVETLAFTSYYGGRPSIAAYWAISITFPTLCLVQLARTAAAHWRSPVPELRIGLRIVAVGAGLGFVYAGLKLAEIVSQTTVKLNLAAAARPADLVLLGLGLSLIAAGLTVTSPSVADHLIGHLNDVRARYLTHRLGWLWETVCIRAGAADVLDDASDLQFRLLRRVIEVRDAEATLWSYLSVADIEQVQRTIDVQDNRTLSAARVEAAGLALAVTRELAGLPQHRRSPQDPQPPRAASRVNSRPLSAEREARELIALSGLMREAMRSDGR